MISPLINQSIERKVISDLSFDNVCEGFFLIVGLFFVLYAIFLRFGVLVSPLEKQFDSQEFVAVFTGS